MYTLKPVFSPAEGLNRKGNLEMKVKNNLSKANVNDVNKCKSGGQILLIVKCIWK